MENKLIIAENLTYLLWSRKIDPNEWDEHLASWANCTPERAKSILSGDPVSGQEQRSISSSVEGVTEEQIQYERLLKEEEILQNNLDFLLGSLEHGEQKELANKMGIRDFTISRFGFQNGSIHPAYLNPPCLAS